MDAVSYLYVVIPVVLLAGVAWFAMSRKPRPELAKPTPATAQRSASTLESVLTNLSAEGFSTPFMDGAGSKEVEKKRTRGDADRLAKDPGNLKKPLIANLVERATEAMNALIPPEKQKLCYRPAKSVEEVIQNIGSVIHDSFAAQVDLSDPTYMYSLTTLMLVRYSLVAAAEDKRDLIAVTKGPDGKVQAVVVRPRMARLMAGLVDKVFDRYYELSPPMKAFVDKYQKDLEAQFNVTLGDVKAIDERARKADNMRTVKAGALMSVANRTMPVNLFAAVMVLLASGEVAAPCGAVPDDVVV